MEQAIKFKEGDKVRIIRKNTNNRRGWVREMEGFTGRIATVQRGCEENTTVTFPESDNRWCFHNEDMELFHEKHVGDIVTYDNRISYKILKVEYIRDIPFYDVLILNNDKFVYRYCRLDASVITQKYQLRDAKGHFIPCERILEPKPAKARKPRVSGVVAKAPKKAAVAPIKAVPEGIPQVALDLRAELQKKRKDGMANYALAFTKSDTRFQINDACHARLCWGYREIEKKKEGDEITAMAMAIDQSFKHVGKLGDQYKDYVSYILKDSHFKDCFITHDVEDAIANGVLFNINRNVSELMGAAIALREAHEYRDKLVVWKDVIDAGYSKDVAFLMSAFISTDNGIRCENGHRLMSQRYALNDLILFMKKGYYKKLPAIFNDKTQTKYEVHNTIFGHNTGKGWINAKAHEEKGKTIAKFLEENSNMEVEGEGWGRQETYHYKESIPMLSKAFQDLLDKYKE